MNLETEYSTKNKGLCRAKHDMTAVCQQEKVEQVSGLTFEGDSCKEVTLWRLTSLSRWSKANFKSPYNFEESPTYFCHEPFMKIVISCLLKSVLSMKYFESDSLEK